MFAFSPSFAHDIINTRYSLTTRVLMSGRWFPFLTLVMLLALSVACEQPGAPATPAPPQALKVSQTVKVGTSTPGPTETPASDPTDSPTPTITPTPLPMLTAGEFTLSYEIHANTLILRTPESAQEVTFPAEITDVTAKGESLKVTLIDGTEKTLTKDKETGEWKEVQIYRTFTELALTAENMSVIKDAVADALVDGAFLDEAEIKEKIEAGELKVVRDEKTGAIMVFTKEALEYMKEKGQSVENSDAARLFQTLEEQNRKVFGKWIDAKVYSYEEYYQKRLDYPEELQKFAERLAKDGGFLPLPPEWMTFTIRLNQANRPEVIAILPQFLDPWDRSYPAGKRIFGNPISFPADKRLVLSVKLWLEGDGQVKKQFIQAPFITQYRGQQLTLEPEANELVNRDEYQTVTHKLDEAKRQWYELKEYEVYGTARERLVQMLTYKVFEERRMVDGKEHTNVFGLDKEKMQAVIDAIEAGKSIEEINANKAKAAGIYILTDAEGNPAQIAIVGGEYGLTAEQLASLKKAAAGIEAEDPGITKFFSEQFGAKFVSGSTSFSDITNEGIFSSNDGVDTIIIGNKQRTVADLIIILLVESGEIHGGRHMFNYDELAGKLSEYKNFGTFAALWAIDWLKLHGDGLIQKGVITQKELNDITKLAKYSLEQYQNSP